MPTLRPCATCANLVLDDALGCPFCRVERPSLGVAAVATLLGLSLSGCFQADAMYGVVITYDDEDGDGYTAPNEDCDDSDASINPGAIDTVDDGIDSNCDGDDNT
jgi:hypothetical protein